MNLITIYNSYTNLQGGGKRPSKARKAWEDRLNADRAGAAPDAEEFTKQFMGQMYR